MATVEGPTFVQARGHIFKVVLAPSSIWEKSPVIHGMGPRSFLRPQRPDNESL